MVIVVLLASTGCSELDDQGVGMVAVELSVHPDGWTQETLPSLHGEAIRAAKWDMRECEQCHGGNYSGGTTGISCQPCHAAPEGPEACFTCHGIEPNPTPPSDLDGHMEASFPGVGAHRECMGSTLRSRPVRCSECHIVPAGMYETGHIDSDLPAEVIFVDSLARTVTNEPTTEDFDLLLPMTAPDPKYDFQTLTCSDTYCHGNFKNGNNFIICWTEVGTGQIRCGSCHGDGSAENPLPKTADQGGSHPDFPECSLCHGEVVDEELNFVDKNKHIDGKLHVFGTERDF